MCTPNDQIPTAALPTRAAHVALALALALTLAAPLAAHAAEGLRVVRDPVTGELRGPNAAEIAAFEKAEAQLRSKGKQPAPSVDIRHPDGTIETTLDPDTVMYSVVREGKNGVLVTACLPAKQANEFVLSAKKTSSMKHTKTKADHVHR